MPEDAGAVRDAITAALQPRLEQLRNATFEIGAIDTRLRLPECPAIQVTLPPGNAAAISAKVECPAPTWTIYVPVRLHAWVDAVVAATNLAPQTKLGPGHLSHGRVDIFNAAGGLVTDSARAEGKILRLGVAAGAPILEAYLEAPLVVHRGQELVLTLSDSAMVIRNTVVALEDGRIGDRINVQSPGSHKTISATVGDDGNVQINF